MPLVSRRRALGALASGTVLASGAAAAAPASLSMDDLKKETDTACVYHCDFGDNARYDAMLRNINNHLSVYNSDPFALKIVIVAHAAGIKYHLKSLEGTNWANNPPIDPEFDKRMAALGQLGVDVLLCRLTFQLNKIDTALAKDAPYIKFVPSGVATVASLQSKGFAYLKCG
jgi:intracellular sulfur oxidation DsrE/DsrF family protein